ncbi:MAG TPA: OpgC domain-containing protein [Caulobacteraceae bacterium]
MDGGAGARPRPAERFAALDGLRGAFLLLMLLSHLSFQGGLALQLLHPRTVSFVDAAFGFVFVSGVVAGLVYGRVMIRDGFRAASNRLLRRALLLYLYAVGVMLALIAAAQLIPAAREWWSVPLGPLVKPDARALAAAVLLLQHVDYADILVQYLVYLLLAPLVLWACLAGRTRLALAASGLLWLGVQLGLSDPVVNGLETLLKALGPDLYLPQMFNLAAWQFLFVCGLVVGARTARHGGDPWRSAVRPDRTAFLWLSLAVLAAIAAIRLLDQWDATHALVDPLLGLLDPVAGKTRLGLLQLVNVAAIAWALAWLAIAAPGARSPFPRAAGGLVHAVLGWSFLQRLGRASLRVYVWHVALVYAVLALDQALGPFPQPVRCLIAVAALALLAVPTLRLPRHSRRTPALLPAE